MRNNFTQKTRELFIDVPCCICGGFQANALHHIMGRISNSPYNAAPIHNQRCHLNKDGKMGRGDLNRFLKELERDAVPRQGLILDLRYNFGGNVHDRVLQALTTPVYAKWQRRGLSETQQSTFGFANKPIVVLINEVQQGY